MYVANVVASSVAPPSLGRRLYILPGFDPCMHAAGIVIAQAAQDDDHGSWHSVLNKSLKFAACNWELHPPPIFPAVGSFPCRRRSGCNCMCNGREICRQYVSRLASVDLGLLRPRVGLNWLCVTVETCRIEGLQL